MNSPSTFTQTMARRLLLWDARSTGADVGLHFTRQPFWKVTSDKLLTFHSSLIT